MKILLDANLSWRLVKRLSPYFFEVKHVRQAIPTDPAKDSEIWQWALTNHYMIVTNDEDFRNFSLIYGFPPKVILLRKGNLVTKEIERILIACRADIEQLNQSSTYGLIEIY